MSRWKEPAVPYAVERTSGLLKEIGGTLRQDFYAVLSARDIERLRQGYLCLNCLEPQERPFPDRCPLLGCGYEMKRYQSVDFSKEFDPSGRHIGPSTTMEEELDRLDDAHERRIHLPGGQILVPSNVAIQGGRVRATGRLHKF